MNRQQDDASPDEAAGSPGSARLSAAPGVTSPPTRGVVIAGGGLGGLATAILLARAGQHVVCIEPERFPHARVGESLDWSSPALLEALGFPREQLIEQGVATYKRKIKVAPRSEPEFMAAPDEWLRHSPFGFEVVTLHVDRMALDQRLFEKAQQLGVRFVRERVTGVETQGQQVMACRTESGQRFSGSWFIDASGRAQLFARLYRIPKKEYGRLKVCLWTYFRIPVEYQGTTFFTDGEADYLPWIWEIPITPDTISVGWVLSADQFSRQRRNGNLLKQILAEELAKYARFAPLVAEQQDAPVLACSWRSYVQKQVSGPNWLMVGESASLPDPLTANGVTAALRHARAAADLILECRQKKAFPKRQLRVYSANVRRMGHAYNSSIETAIYHWPLRRGLSTLIALTVYAHFGYLMNALYTKFRPQGRPSMLIFWLLFRGVRLWMVTWSLIGRAAFEAKRLWHRLCTPSVPARASGGQVAP